MVRFQGADIDLGPHPDADAEPHANTDAAHVLTPEPGSGSPRTTPRLIAPLSTSISTSMSPMFTLAGGERQHGRYCRRLPGSGLPEHHRLVRGDRIVGAAAAAASPRRRLLARVERHDRRADLGGLGAHDPRPGERTHGELGLGARLQRRRIRGSRGGRPAGVQRRRHAAAQSDAHLPGWTGGPAATPAQTFSGSFGFAEEAGSAGDLDGDGFADLAIWNSVESRGGRAAGRVHRDRLPGRSRRGSRRR